MTVEHITKEDFYEKVLHAKSPVLVDFFASWCGPCKALTPVIEELAEEISGQSAVYKVNVEESPELASQFKIMGVPTLIVFENGNIKTQTSGFQTKAALKQLLNI